MVNSDQPENVDLGVAAQAKRIAAFLTALGWSNGTLVGHDIGGGIAQLIAVDQTFGSLSCRAYPEGHSGWQLAERYQH
jgi:hypothetical protein